MRVGREGSSPSQPGKKPVQEVLGPAPTREAAQIYRKLLRDAHHLGVTINWEQARSEQITIRPQPSLVAAARHQISRGL
ncbi:MAG TPA: hypothetical protein VF148_03810 [Acidimicrobiia bacterium]